jgi:putative glutamine amidotransferase
MSEGFEDKRPRVAVTHDAGYNIDAYLRAVERAGGDPVAVTAESGVSMHDFDALLISGGLDVDPALYGQARAAETDDPDRDRDRLETGMLRQALDEDKPVLAICRGLQLFNVAQGGTLLQHIERHRQADPEKSAPSHTVQVDPGSRLAGLLGAKNVPVNSRHHQAVGEVSPAVSVTAVAEDGTIEALERPDKDFAVAVQWHPENMAESDPAQRQLFEGFIAAARAAER